MINRRGIMALVVVSPISLKDPYDSGSGKYAVYRGDFSPYFKAKFGVD
jgi:hypothetical protein